MEKALILQLVNLNKELGQSWDLKEDTTYLIGRNIDKSHIVINDSTISRVHAELTLEGGKIYLKDLGSANGTFVNGKPIEKMVKVEILPNNKIILGDSKVILFITDKTSVKEVAPIEDNKPFDIIKMIEEEEEGNGHLIKRKRSKSDKKQKKSQKKLKKHSKKSKKNKKSKKRDENRNVENLDSNLSESNKNLEYEAKILEYLRLREKEKKAVKEQINLDLILRSENPKLQQIQVKEKRSLIGIIKPTNKILKDSKSQMKQWITKKETSSI